MQSGVIHKGAGGPSAQEEGYGVGRPSKRARSMAALVNGEACALWRTEGGGGGCSNGAKRSVVCEESELGQDWDGEGEEGREGEEGAGEEGAGDETRARLGEIEEAREGETGKEQVSSNSHHTQEITGAQGGGEVGESSSAIVGTRREYGKTIKLEPGSYTLHPRMQRGGGSLRLRQLPKRGKAPAEGKEGKKAKKPCANEGDEGEVPKSVMSYETNHV